MVTEGQLETSGQHCGQGIINASWRAGEAIDGKQMSGLLCLLVLGSWSRRAL